MVKGISVKFQSYSETIPKLLKVLKFDVELKKHENVVLKPWLSEKGERTPIEFVEQVLRFCVEHKNPGSEIFIAEGCDGHETEDVFEELGYRALAERYGVGLVDLNKTETVEIESPEFLRFEKIKYPKILKKSFVVSMPYLANHEELQISASLDNMLGAFPAKHYRGLFSNEKNKIRKWPIKYQVHDILKCKLPDFALIDASKNGVILAGQPIEMDKQAAGLMGLNWRTISHLNLIDESFSKSQEVSPKIVK